MSNPDPRSVESLKAQMCRPEGTVGFEYYSAALTSRAAPGGRLFEVVSGQHFFMLERTDDVRLCLYHSSPGTGTRVAVIDLKELGAIVKAYVAFTWSPDKLTLYFGRRNPNGELLHADGQASPIQFRIGLDGLVYRVGDEGVEVMDVKLIVGGKVVVQRTALEAWENMRRAVEVLKTGQSDQAYIHEVVVTNMAVSMMVTGYEAYCKTRFLELEMEGIVPDEEDVRALAIHVCRLSGEGLQRIAGLAKKKGISIIAYLIGERKINFQSFLVCKDAYKRLYRVDFPQIISTETAAKLQMLIKHRHNVVHVSALAGEVEASLTSRADPVHANAALLEDALNAFSEFVMGLHEASLKLRPHPSR